MKIENKNVKAMIFELPDGKSLAKRAEYTIDAKKALVCFIMQFIHNNWNTWEYPETLEGMRESPTSPGTWYFDHGKSVYAAYPAQ